MHLLKISLMVELSHLKKGEVYLYRDDKGILLPADEDSQERLKKLKAYEVYSFKFKKTRNYLFLKKYFAMLKCAFENQEFYKAEKFFREHTLLGIGHCEVWYNAKGEASFKVKSISFDNCTELEFDAIFQKTLSFLMLEYGFDEDFQNHLLSFA